MLPLSSTVIAVPPLARDAAYRLQPEENQRLIRHMEAGGVRRLLYGGNANFYHLRPSEYAATLTTLAECAGPDTEIIPSAGPAYGLSLDQAAIARDFPFPTIMVLPNTGFHTPDGVATGLRHFAEAFGRPVVIYIKAEGYLTPELAAALMKDGAVSWIKYAIVRKDPAQDAFLAELLELVDRRMIVSGMGEQPVIRHLRDDKLGGFTTGCGCIAPRLSMAMLAACNAGDWAEAERIRLLFKPLEDLRDGINPVRVLHAAVAAAGVAETGPVLPLMSDLSAQDQPRVAATTREVLAQESATGM